jgi:hypothetical protein
MCRRCKRYPQALPQEELSVKRAVSIILIFVFFAVFAAGSFAQAIKPEKGNKTTIKGEIILLDRRTNQMVVREDATGDIKTITADHKFISTLRRGDHVKIKLKKGTNIAKSVKVIK